MLWLTGFLFGSSMLPLWRGWRANQATSLAHALLWAGAAWLAWALVMLLAVLGLPELLPAARYLAVCLLACAGVAVLGARRPGVAAWNFVVLGLLSVFLLWFAEGLLGTATVELGIVRGVFLIGTLAVGILNYVPTRLAPAALLLAAAMTLEVIHLIEGHATADLAATTCLLALAPWAGWLAGWRDEHATAFDRLWRSFRDRYGFMWGQRLREQFNRSAVNSGWPVELGWSSLRRTSASGPDDAELLATLQALMKRFGVGESQT